LYEKKEWKIPDAISSWWVNVHGHAHPYIAEAIGNQAKKLEHVIFAGFTHQPTEDLSSRILDFFPGEIKRMFFTDKESTAKELALQMVLQFHHLKKKKKQGFGFRKRLPWRYFWGHVCGGKKFILSCFSGLVV